MSQFHKKLLYIYSLGGIFVAIALTSRMFIQVAIDLLWYSERSNKYALFVATTIDAVEKCFQASDSYNHL